MNDDYRDNSVVEIYGPFARDIKLLFKKDTWSCEEAAFLLGGVLPIKYTPWGYPKLNGGLLSSHDGEREETADYVETILDIWKSNPAHSEYATPKQFISWALEKGLPIPWLKFAIDNELLPADVVENDPTAKEAGEVKQPDTVMQPAFNEATPPYSTPWLTIQQAAITEFFNPRRNPDAKRDEVVAWIKQQAEKAGLPDSNNVATTIFTIIKPANHDPKKKRAEPLE